MVIKEKEMGVRSLALIVLNFEQFDMTKKCVDNLLNIGVKDQIIIVDNHSRDNSYELLKKEYIHISNIYICRTPRNGGYAYGNNFGVKKAEKLGEYTFIGILNPDVIIPANYFSKLCSILESHEDYAVISTLMCMNGYIDTENSSWKLPTPKDIYRQHFLAYRCKYKRKSYKMLDGELWLADVLSGSFFVIKKDILKQIGYLDEHTFLYNEENILAIKLRQCHKKSVLYYKNYYLHEHANLERKRIMYDYKHNFQSIFNNYVIGYQSRIYICRQYYSGKYLYRLKIVHFLNLIILGCKYLTAYMLSE